MDARRDTLPGVRFDFEPHDLADALLASLSPEDAAAYHAAVACPNEGARAVALMPLHDRVPAWVLRAARYDRVRLMAAEGLAARLGPPRDLPPRPAAGLAFPGTHGLLPRYRRDS